MILLSVFPKVLFIVLDFVMPYWMALVPTFIVMLCLLYGLRAMFFLLAAIADKFRYLKTGVCVLLVFIGVKMLIHKYFEIDAIASLLFIIAVLIISIGASLIIPQKKDSPVSA